MRSTVILTFDLQAGLVGLVDYDEDSDEEEEDSETPSSKRPRLAT